MFIVIPVSRGESTDYVKEILETKKIIDSKHSAESRKLQKLIKNAETVDPDDFSQEFKKLNFKIYGLVAKILQKIDSPVPETNKNRQIFLSLRENLSQLEYKESNVEKVYDLIQNHFKNLEEKIFKGHWRLFIDYVSWQNKAVLTDSGSEYDLIITNKGICPGINYARENKNFSFSVDACFMLASGEVKALDPTALTYSQSNVHAVGLKGSLGIGHFVSSTKSEIGLKIPVIFVSQLLQDPPNSGATISEGSEFIPMAGIYSRWPLGKFFVQTEFSKFLSQDHILWALGAGYGF